MLMREIKIKDGSWCSCSPSKRGTDPAVAFDARDDSRVAYTWRRAFRRNLGRRPERLRREIASRLQHWSTASIFAWEVYRQAVDRQAFLAEWFAQFGIGGARPKYAQGLSLRPISAVPPK